MGVETEEIWKKRKENIAGSTGYSGHDKSYKKMPPPTYSDAARAQQLLDQLLPEHERVQAGFPTSHCSKELLFFMIIAIILYFF